MVSLPVSSGSGGYFKCVIDVIIPSKSTILDNRGHISLQRTWTTFAATQYFLKFLTYNGRIRVKLGSKIPKSRWYPGENMEKCFCEITCVRLGQFWKTLYIQLFLGRPCICKPKKCNSSTQKSKPRAGAWLEEASLDQSGIRRVQPWSVIGPDLLLQVKLRAWVLTSVVNYDTF